MRLGLSLPVAGTWATPANPVRVAQEAERLGYHSLWVLQRLLSLDEIRDDVRRYADLGLTELFLEANVALHGWPVERTLEVMAALAPDRCLPFA
jgi:hypothetical protein